MLTDGTIQVKAYNLETILAEKVETILRRGVLNTRPRDDYNAYRLTTHQQLGFERTEFWSAL